MGEWTFGQLVMVIFVSALVVGLVLWVASARSED